MLSCVESGNCKEALRSRGLFDSAQAEMRLGKKRSAIQLFKASIETSRGGDFLYCRRAYYFLGQLTGNNYYYEDGARKGDLECAYKYAIYLSSEKALPRTVVRWLKLAVAQPHALRGEAFYALGVNCLQNNKEVDGIKYIETAVLESCEAASDFLLQISCLVPEIFETNSCPFYEKAVAFFYDGEAEKAIKNFGKIVPKSPLIYYTIGLIYLSLENKHSTGISYICKAATAQYPHENAIAFLQKLKSFF